jgi:pyruvate-ferredoxin/flavodoxin oxidoreductase
LAAAPLQPGGAPRTRFREYAYNELRYRMLQQASPTHAEELMKRAEEAVTRRWATYAEMAGRGG